MEPLDIITAAMPLASNVLAANIRATNQWLQNMPLVTSDDSPSASNLYHLHVLNCFRIPIGLYARGVCRHVGWCTLSIITSGFLNIFPSCIIMLPLECTYSL